MFYWTLWGGGSTITYFSTRKGFVVYTGVCEPTMVWEGYNWILKSFWNRHLWQNGFAKPHPHDESGGDHKINVVVVGCCWLLLLLLLLVVVVIGCCCYWLLLLLVVAVVGCCCCWLLLLLVVAVVGCCCCCYWLLLLLVVVVVVIGCCLLLLNYCYTRCGVKTCDVKWPYDKSCSMAFCMAIPNLRGILLTMSVCYNHWSLKYNINGYNTINVIQIDTSMVIIQ